MLVRFSSSTSIWVDHSNGETLYTPDYQSRVIKTLLPLRGNETYACNKGDTLRNCKKGLLRSKYSDFFVDILRGDVACGDSVRHRAPLFGTKYKRIHTMHDW